MQATTERRQQMLEYISVRRRVQYQELMSEFHISKKTAQRDVEVLSCSYPIFTRTTSAGGIFAMDGWYASKSYLRDDQEALLRKLLPGLQPEDQKTMQSILDAFAKPKIKEADRERKQGWKPHPNTRCLHDQRVDQRNPRQVL